jgi:medium-chain acyl-[acyl-carrier-protein] hydrolase
MEIKFVRTYGIHTYEVDFEGRVHPVALLNYLQDAAGRHALAHGFSIPDLVRKGLTWVLSRYHARIFRYPMLGENVEVQTWPSGRQGVFALRDFIMTGADGGTILTATSSFMILDLNSKKPVRMDGLIPAEAVLEERALPDDFRSLPEVAETPDPVRFPVRRQDLDFNRHVNNVVYIQWGLEAVPRDILMSCRPSRIEISYKAEAFLGDAILSGAREDSGGEGRTFLHRIARESDGAEIARMRTIWE